MVLVVVFSSAISTCTERGTILSWLIKVAVNTIVPRSPLFSICTSKPTLFTHIKKMLSNISVNEMALFV